MKHIHKLITFLSGKKTYIAAALMVALGVVQSDMQLILEGVTVAALRAGIAKK